MKRNKKTNVKNLTIIFLLCLGCLPFLHNLNLSTTANNSENDTMNSVINSFTPQTKIASSNNLTVAILNTDGTDQPSYFNGGWSNNYTVLYNGLVGNGYNTILINNTNILSGVLANVSVLIMIDNVPNDTASTVVKNWYLAGGSILSFDSSICFLNWAGILPAEAANTDGYLTYWDYNAPSSGIVVDNSSPIMVGYNIGDTIYGQSGDAEYNNSAIMSSSAAPYYIPLVKASAGSNFDLISAYAPPTGGYVVQDWDRQQFSVTANQMLIMNMINWLMSVSPVTDNLRVSLQVPQFIQQNQTVTLNATVTNNGFNTEQSINVTLWINGSKVANQNISTLTPGMSTFVYYNWNTSILGSYNITAYVSPVINETYLSDNIAQQVVQVRVPSTMAILMDQDPWGYSSIEDALNLYGISYDIISSTEFGTISLSGYSKVVIASNQPQAFNDAILNNKLWLETYVSNGGVLEINSATNAVWNGSLPGGATYTALTSDSISIGDPNSPMLNTPNIITASELNNWGSSVHGYLSGVNFSDIVLSSNGSTVLAEQKFGAGFIIISSQTLEFAYGNSKSKILENVLLDYSMMSTDHNLYVTLDPIGAQAINSTTTINATVFNVGKNNETNVVLQLWINQNLTDSHVFSVIDSGTNVTYSYAWTPMQMGFYNITAYVLPVINESILYNNKYTQNAFVIDPNRRSIAILNANSTDLPSYWNGGLSNNYLNLYNGLINAGFPTIIVTNNDILSGALVNVSVLIMIDNAPNDAASTVVKDWYFAGGSILSFDSSICFLNWAGILPAEAANTDGFSTYWDYGSPSSGVVVDNSTPIMAGYNIGDIIYGQSGDAEYINSAIMNSSAAPYYFPLVKASAGSNLDLISAYAPPSGGYVVQAWDNKHWDNTANDQFILNAINWLSTVTPVDHELRAIVSTPQLTVPNQQTTLNITCVNQGIKNETNVEVDLFINSVLVHTFTIANFLSGSIVDFSYLWTPATIGTYNITAYIVPVFNESNILDNQETKFVQVTIPLSVTIGSYINYDSSGSIWGTFTYEYMLDATHVYVDGYQSSYGNFWFSVDINSGYINAGSMWVGYYFPAQISANLTIGSAADWLDQNGTVTGSFVYNWNGESISAWNVSFSPTYFAYFQQSTGLWIYSNYNGYEITMVDTNLIPDTISPILIMTPVNISYVQGSYGNSLSWIAEDLHPGSYVIFQNGMLVNQSYWISNLAVKISVDGLSVGSYNFTIVFTDSWGNEVSNSVYVTVTADTTTSNPISYSIPFSTNPSPSSPTTESPPQTSDSSNSFQTINTSPGFGLIIFIALISIASLVRLFRIRKQR